jgi:hypothetical protein
MHSLLSELLSWLACRFHGRVELELEVTARRHQLAVLRRQRSGRTQLFAIDRLIWVWLYRVVASIPECPRAGEARDRGSMASARLSALLALPVKVGAVLPQNLIRASSLVVSMGTIVCGAWCGYQKLQKQRKV